MNTTERRVSDLLRAYGERLEMTTQDIDRLEHGLEQKQAARKRRRTRITQAAVAAGVVTGVVLGALLLRTGQEPTTVPAAPAPPPPAMTQLEGIWREEPQQGQEPTGWLWNFDSQGLAIDSGPDDLFLDQPTHRLALVSGGFTITDLEASDCSTRFSTSISPEGRIRATVATSTPAQGRMCDLQKGDVWDLTRISPVSPAGAGVTSLWPARAPSPVKFVQDLAGTWLLKGTGRVLTITGTGDYEVRDPSNVDRNRKGTVTVGKDGKVTFTAADDRTCIATYYPVTTTSNGFAAPLRENLCARLGRAGDEWIRLN